MPAGAHSLSSRFGDFYGGMLHPVTALEHVLPIVALGLLAGQQGTRGALAAAGVSACPAVGRGARRRRAGTALAARPQQASFALLGALVAGAWRLPLPVLAGMAALFGLSHGYANGSALTPEMAAHLFLPGVALIGFMAAAVVSAATLALIAKAQWLRIGVRVVGSWIAAIGILMVGMA